MKLGKFMIAAGRSVRIGLSVWFFITLCVAVLLSSGFVYAAGVVTDCTESNLRAAMSGGGTVTFACDGTITLSKTITNSVETILDGNGHVVTVSGSNTVRVFYVNTNVTFAVANLTIANGRATNGAGIFNAGGTVNATNCIFSYNKAQGSIGISTGGEGAPGQDGCGGAVDNFGVVNFIDCSFTGNSATGGAGGSGDSVYIPGYMPYLGGKGGIGFGGAVCNYGLLTARGCTFSRNSAAGGIGGSGGSFSGSSTSPVAGAGGGSGGRGNGGALHNGGVANLVNCTLVFNTGAGGAGGPGGSGSRPPTPDYPPGQAGGNGGYGLGFGGIYDASGQCHLTNCTLAFNSGTGNSSSTGGIGTSGGMMVNTLLAENSPANGSSGIADLGHNLSSDNSCMFTNSGSLNATYALLGSLANNGGLTATIALLPGSIAIDAGDTSSSPPTDQRGVPRPFGMASDIGAYEYDAATNPPPSHVVSSCTEAGLRAAMAGGGLVTFDCDGTISLAGTIFVATDSVLDATGHQICISGRNSVQVFLVNSNINFTAINLTVANGRGGSGAGIFNEGGIVTLLGVTLRSNVAYEISGLLSQGGAILNKGGNVNATNCTFTGNSAVGTNTYSARGGAIRNESGEVNLLKCIFTTNRTTGAAGANGQAFQNGYAGMHSWGGAVDNSGMLRVSQCSFTGNSATGSKGGDGGLSFGSSNGGPGGTGAGGAINNDGDMEITHSTFSGNVASGGAGGSGGWGVLAEPGGWGGNGGTGGSGNGGAIFNAGAAQLINSTFVFNFGAGSSGGNGGNGGQARMVMRGGNGGDGGNGGSAFGAIYDSNGSCWITNCTLALNSATNGSGGAGGYGGPGSIWGSPGISGTLGMAGGGIRTIGGTLVNTLLATNAGSNCFGSVTDAGHNLSSDASCAFTNVGSLNNTNPKLGPLADYGGQTMTMALLSGSPAIDAADNVLAPATDQRGFARPVGMASDIGAFEYDAPFRIMHISAVPGGGINLLVGGGAFGQSCCLLSCESLSTWSVMATNKIGTNGIALFHVNNDGSQRFYRAKSP